MRNSTASTDGAAAPRWLSRAAGAVAVLAGWALIVAVYRGRLTPSAVTLAIGWAALVATAWLLWGALWTAVGSGGGGDAIEPADLDALRRGDLEREKRALLRAIKDVEFDRDMGKMSPAEADEILRVYRARAIEVIRELEAGVLDDPTVPIDEAIDREVAARIGVRPGRGQAPRAEVDRLVRQVEASERRGRYGYRAAAGALVAAASAFAALATWSPDAGAGHVVGWGLPVAAGLALAGHGLYRWLTYSEPDHASDDDGGGAS
ncbi:MAG: hypothetical protein D6689_03870 [Deltaproteobacteria bacterium]|nr:MAG: hypothetical protein D6689_03870 [Deltaproteobacteria bacterium]